MNPSMWEWPQWVFAVLMLISVLAAPLLHGKERSKFDGFSIILSNVIQFFILWAGGFWQ